MAERKARPTGGWWVTVVLLLMGSLAGQCGELGEVILQLKNGDRLSGKVISEDAERVVLTTKWSAAIYVPKTEIERREIVVSEIPAAAAPPTVAVTNQVTVQAPQPVITQVVAESKPKPAPPAPPETKKLHNWKWDLKLGTDIIAGASDRQNYYGQTSLTFARSYAQNPREFLRNTLDYRIDYGQTDGRVTSDRMYGSNKLDLDIGRGFFAYTSGGVGYDRPRRIALQYEVGPGLGYHILAKKAVVLNAELGVNYQSREGLEAPDREVFQSRIGQDLTWHIVPKLTFSQKFEFLPFISDGGNYLVRVEGNLGVGLVNHVSLNLTVLNLYDSLPGPNVPPNEFQFRSALGVTF